MDAEDHFKKIVQARGSVDISGMCQAACPFIGSMADPQTPMGYPHPANRCFRHGEALEREQPFQRAYCLSPQYEACAIFQEPDMVESAAPAAGQRKHGLRLAVPVAVILILLLGVVTAPVLVHNASGGSAVDRWLERGPAKALFRDAPTTIAPEGTTAGPGIEEAPTENSGSLNAVKSPAHKPSGAEAAQGTVGSGRFRTVPYNLSD